MKNFSKEFTIKFFCHSLFTHRALQKAQIILTCLWLLVFSFLYVNNANAQQNNNQNTTNYVSNHNANISAQEAINNAIAVLVGLLQSENPEARMNAARAIGGLGNHGKIAKPVLIAALKDKDPRVRYSAAIALTNLGEQTPATLPLLIEALQNDSQMIRNDAVSAISTNGYSLRQKLSQLSKTELQQTLSSFEEALSYLQKLNNTSFSNSITAIRNHRNLLEEEIKRR